MSGRDIRVSIHRCGPDEDVQKVHFERRPAATSASSVGLSGGTSGIDGRQVCYNIRAKAEYEIQ